MSDDWKVGDLALCVNDRECVFGKLFPDQKTGLVTLGRVYSVTGITRVAATTPFGVGSLLALDGVAWERCQDGGVGAWRFIKVTPREADAFDHETIQLMNRKPVEAVS